MKIRMLSAEDIHRALDMREAIEAMKGAFKQLSMGDAVMPLRGEVGVPKSNGVSLFMPGYLPAKDEMAIKIVSVFTDNPRKGLPLIHGLIIVVNSTTGEPTAVMEGSYLTALRTGAASGAATDLLARNDATKVGIIGTGVQGRTQLQAVCAVRDIQNVCIYDIIPDKANQFAYEMGEVLSLKIQVTEDVEKTVRNADIICTATTSSTPIFEDKDIQNGTHINAVGAYTPEMQEVPSETVARSKVVIDQMEASMAEAGDLLIPMKAGIFSEEHVYAELGQIAAGIKPGRESEEEITFFKSVGVAVQDVAAANLVLGSAERLNLGVEFEL